LLKLHLNDKRHGASILFHTHSPRCLIAVKRAYAIIISQKSLTKVTKYKNNVIFYVFL
jgi:hypothetical protein